MNVKVGDTVVLRGYEQRSGTACGIVRAVTPRRIVVWTGATGWGQRRWPFDNHGKPVGETAVSFPTVCLEAIR